MSAAQRSKTSWLRFLALATFVALLGAGGYGYQYWKKKDAQEDMVASGLTLINYTDMDVYASVWNAEFPNPGQGASEGVGPRAGGGGTVCCVPIPSRWRPGIKMLVWYSNKNWQPENGVVKVVDLPEYPDGRPGSLYLMLHSESELELLSSIYAPGHPLWPGKQVEPVAEWLNQ